MKNPWKESHKKGQTQLSLPELGLAINIKEKPILDQINPILGGLHTEIDIDKDTFISKRIEEGETSQSALDLWEIAQKRRSSDKHES